MVLMSYDQVSILRVAVGVVIVLLPSLHSEWLWMLLLSWRQVSILRVVVGVLFK